MLNVGGCYDAARLRRTDTPGMRIGEKHKKEARSNDAQAACRAHTCPSATAVALNAFRACFSRPHSRSMLP